MKRAYWSLVFLIVLSLLSLGAELFMSSRALLVRYQGKYYFPTYGDILPGKTFGLDYDGETKYRDLREKFFIENKGDFVLMPYIPYGPYENHNIEGEFAPYPPSFETAHFMGTDMNGRDLVARMMYGFRLSFFFSVLYTFCSYLIGVSLGCFMGYTAGRFDLIFQRFIEIWSLIPQLFILMILGTVVRMTPALLLAALVAFGWMGMTWYMRTATYKEKERDYIAAAKVLGASTPRILFNHILPNTMSIIVTFLPFSISAGIVVVTSLDYLGFGFQPPTPSWGELLKQGTDNLHYSWIATSIISMMGVILIAIIFIGEGIREAFDPKRHSTYE